MTAQGGWPRDTALILELEEPGAEGLRGLVVGLVLQQQERKSAPSASAQGLTEEAQPLGKQPRAAAGAEDTECRVAQE